MKETLNNGEIHSLLGTLSTVKMTVLLKLICIFKSITQSQSKPQQIFKIKIGKKILTVVWKFKEPRLSKESLQRKTKLENLNYLISGFVKN